MNKEELSRSEAAHRRKVLAGKRREIPPDFLERRVGDLLAAEKRLREISNLLDGDDNLSPDQEASLTVESIWLKFRLEKLNQTERQSQLQRYLDKLEKEHPEVYDWLVGQEQANGSTPLAKIRDRVMPPSSIQGYHTKRGR